MDKKELVKRIYETFDTALVTADYCLYDSQGHAVYVHDWIRAIQNEVIRLVEENEV